MRPRPRPLLAIPLAVLLAGVVGSSVGVAQPAAGQDEVVDGERVVIAAGHVDVGPRLVEGEWSVRVRDDTVVPEVWRALDDVVFQALDVAQVTVPDDPRFGFLGEPGQVVWILPQVQQLDLTWLGWNTESPEIVDALDGSVTWTLHEVDGPGEFVLFLSLDFGDPEVLFDTADPLPQEMPVTPNSHVHGNWVFTVPGTYLLDVEMSATVDGEPVADRGWLRVFVGDGDATGAFDADAPELEPVAATTTTSAATGGGSSFPWALVALGALALVVAGALVLALRRRGSAP